MSRIKTFAEFNAMTDAEIGQTVRKFLEADRRAVEMGAHSTSQKLAVSGNIMLKILTDEYDEEYD